MKGCIQEMLIPANNCFLNEQPQGTENCELSAVPKH